MNTIWNDIKNNYKSGNSFTKLLYVNLAFFIAYNLLAVFSYLFKFGGVVIFTKDYLFLPSNTNLLLQKPWTLITYMFVHTDFIHILFNLIWLHFGSKLFLQYFTGKQLVSTYILGGITGGLFFIISFNIFPVFSQEVLTSKALGASASVLAIFVAIATYAPNFSVQFPFIGSLKIKHIALTLVILDFLSISPENPGGHIAHLGGAIFGFLYIVLLKKGIDLSVNFHKFIGYFSFNFKRKSKLNKIHKRSKKGNDDSFRQKKSDSQKQINLILEKISRSGYESLTNDEKNILFKESKK